MAKRKNWSRLDNAAKVFPSTDEKTDTRVFRFSCELCENINVNLLKPALDSALKDFPHFRCIMRKGFFWYYLEESDIVPLIREEYKPLCAALNPYGEKGLLFEVTYYKKRINLEVYHVLADGTGAVEFLKKLVSEYLLLLHPEINREQLSPDDTGSVYQKSQDSFAKYYKKDRKERTVFVKKAYRYKKAFNYDDTLTAIEGMVSSSLLKQAATRFGCSIGVYLISAMILAFHSEMSKSDEKKAVAISIPVNLRKYFPSHTAKNFFGMVKTEYKFDGKAELSDIIHSVKNSLEKQLTTENLAVRMNTLSSLEHNFFIRIAPLPIKNIFIRIGKKISDKGVTSVVSNMGKITLPEVLGEYVESFHVYASTASIQLCVCTYRDNTAIDFTSAFACSEVERRFFEILKENEITAKIYSNKRT